MPGEKTTEERKAERRALQTDVEFVIDGDIETAVSVNVSETGIRFDTRRPMKVRMRFEMDGRRQEFLGRLVWAGKNPDNTMTYGFEFIPDDEEAVF